MRSVAWLAAVCAVAVLGSACALDTEGLAIGNAPADAGPAGTGNAGSAGTWTSGGSSGSGGSGGGSASGGAGGGGGSAGTPSENCLDGVDNDFNNLADCADPACQAGYQCVPQAPTGFTGYAHTRGDVYGASPGPPCADGVNPTRYYSDPAGPASCTPCSCGAMSGGQCAEPQLLCSTSSTSCDPASDATQADGDCHNGPSSVSTLSCKLGPAQVVAPGSCPPAGGDFSNKDPFGSVTDVCRTSVTPGGGCTAGQVCVPRGAGDYAGYVCVEQAGDVACPGDWGVRIVTYDGESDDRSCVACSCAPTAVQCAGAEYKFWHWLWCIPPPLVDPLTVDSEQCKNLSSVTDFGDWSFRRNKLPTLTGSCTPSGGQPTGAVNPTNAITFCCRN